MPSELYNLFAAAYASGSYAQKGITRFGYLNKIVLGPSTHASNPGAIEIHYVANASGLVVTVDPAKTIAYLYSAGDPVTIIGLGLPDGWTISFPGGGLHTFYGGSMLADAVDSYSADPNMYLLTNFSADAQVYIRLPKLAPYTYYTLLAKLKVDGTWTNTGTATLGIRNNVNGVVAQTTVNVAATATDWHEYSVSFQLTSDANPYYILLYAGSDVMPKLRIAGLALGTTEEYNIGSISEYTSADFKTIGDNPAVGGVRIGRFMEGGSPVVGIDGKARIDSILNSQIFSFTRYQVTYEVVDASADTYDFFRTLASYCSRGYFVTHLPDVPGLPYAMVGRLSVDISEQYLQTNFGLRKFLITFIEVPT
jgi:hypothetical protein